MQIAIYLFRKNLWAVSLSLSLCFFMCQTQTAQANPTTTDLTGIYEGPSSEGRSLYYIRQIGNRVFFFGERYDARFAYAFRGTISGSIVEGEWYNLPKGRQRSEGTLRLQVSTTGDVLTVLDETGGFMNTQLTAIPLSHQTPATRRAHYRGNTLKNLTGRWHAENACMLQMVDIDGLIVFYAESPRFDKATYNNGIPGKASLFFGKRVGEFIEGDWVDLPFGTVSSMGSVRFKVIGPHYIRYESGYFPGVNFKRVEEDKLEIIE